MAAVAMRPRAPLLHLRRPHALHRASPIRSRHCSLLSSPNPSRLGGFKSPVHTTARRRRRRRAVGEEEEENGGTQGSAARREAGAAREEEPDPRKPSTPATPCFLDFLFTAPPLCFPYQCRLPRHHVAHLFTDAFTAGSPWPIGEHRVPLSSVAPSRQAMDACRPCVS
jgi:hypothetical protein